MEICSCKNKHSNQILGISKSKIALTKEEWWLNIYKPMKWWVIFCQRSWVGFFKFREIVLGMWNNGFLEQKVNRELQEVCKNLGVAVGMMNLTFLGLEHRQFRWVSNKTLGAFWSWPEQEISMHRTS